MELKSYRLPLNWQVTFPDSWEHEYDVQYGANIFYPTDSDLTFRITALHAEQQGIPAPAAIMETVLLQELPDEAQELDMSEFAFNDCRVRAFSFSKEEDGKQVFCIYAGFSTDGDLLLIHITSSDWEQVKAAVSYLRLITREAPAL